MSGTPVTKRRANVGTRNPGASILVLQGLAVLGAAAWTGLKKAQQASADALERKRRIMLDQIDAHAEEASRMFDCGFARMAEGLENVVNQCLETKKALTEKANAFSQRREAYLKTEGETIANIFSIRDDSKITNSIKALSAQAKTIASEWEDFSRAFVNHARSARMAEAAFAAVADSVEVVTRIETATDAQRGVTTLIKENLDLGDLKSAAEKAHEALANVKAANAGKTDLIAALEKLEALRAVMAAVVMNADASEQKIRLRHSRILDHIGRKDYKSAMAECRELISDLSKVRSRFRTREYAERKARYNKAMNSLFSDEKGLEYHRSPDLAVLAENSALALDNGDYARFDDSVSQLEKRMGLHARDVIGGIFENVFHENGLRDIRRDETGDTLSITGSYQGSPVVAFINAELASTIDVPNGTGEHDRACHSLLSKIFLGYRDKMLERGLEIDLLNLVLKWRTQEAVKGIVSDPALWQQKPKKKADTDKGGVYGTEGTAHSYGQRPGMGQGRT